MNVLFEDAQLIVCVKPTGILSQSSPQSLPGEDMLSLLGEERHCTIYPLHRLDRGTSGVMVFAKTKRVAGELSARIAEGALQKEYLCVAHGVPAPAEGEMTDLLYHDAARGKTFVVDRMRRGVREAALDYRLLQTLPGDDPLSLLHIRLRTGRTHQIRAQLSSRRMPLAGDGKYGARDAFPSPALHAFRLTFPYAGRTLRFEALPALCDAPWSLFDSLSQPVKEL